MQTAYDPHRLRKVLKRAGKRGENKWVSIPFEQGVKEICEGGRLFAEVEGESDRHVEGLRDIAVLRDAEVSHHMAADVEKIWAADDPDEKHRLVEQFKVDRRRHAG